MYTELRRIARRERKRMPSATLNTTALVHEAWMRLSNRESPFNSSRHFLATAAVAMRQVVVDYARRRLAGKRGGDAEHVELGDPAEPETASLGRILDIENALKELEQIDPDLPRLVELRFFAGLSRDEAAQVLDISPRTASREWAKARSLLRIALSDHDGGEAA
jgi:RNA polymerase sigma factor (TIGR02999 family)